MTVGGAQVSEKHAGFVINRGGATFDDVVQLMEHIQKTVFEKSGVRLEPEIKVFCFEKSEKDYQSLSPEEQQEEVMNIKNGLNFARKVLTTDGCDILILDEPTAGLDPKGRDEILDQLALLHKTRGISVVLVSHSMEDIAKYAERLIVVNDGEIAYDDAPKAVFAHYRELEAMGLAAPQITYIMHALKEKGLDVDVTATTVDEAKENILAVLRKCNPGKLSGDKQSVSDSQSKKENAKAETLISEMEADLTEDGTKESHSDVPDEDLSIQKETMDKKCAEQEENEGGQEV